MRRIPRLGGLLLGVYSLAVLVSADTVLAQCALCRTALESSPEGQAMAAGFNAGILFLLAAPFVIVATGVLMTLRAVRTAGAR